jgi:hypothetical protein
MPYAIFNRFTKEYVTSGYGDQADISNARTFKQKNHAHTCSDYKEGIHELVPLILTEDVGAERVRKGTLLTEAEYLDKYNGELFFHGEQIEGSYYGDKVLTLQSPDRSIQHTFHVQNSKVYQVMLVDRGWTPGKLETVSLEVHPTKQKKLSRY